MLSSFFFFDEGCKFPPSLSLFSFSSCWVENLLSGDSPPIMEVATSQSIDGDILLVVAWYLLHKYDTQLFGECCESVPLDRTGSYISISMKNTMYINNYNTCCMLFKLMPLFIKYL